MQPLSNQSPITQKKDKAISSPQKEAFWERHGAFILPVFGVLSAFIGPWLLVGLLYLVVTFLNAYVIAS